MVNTEHDYDDAILGITTKEETKEPTEQEVKKPRKKEKKKSRKELESAEKISVNMTIRKEYQIRMGVLAAERMVRPWVILDEALEQYFRKVLK